MAPCWIRYSQRRSRGKNILGGERLQNAKYLVLLKINTNGHKHPSFSLFIIEQDTIGENKKKKWHSTQEPRSPQSYRLWWGAASPILNDTPCVCIYTSYNPNSYKECIRTGNYISTQKLWTGTTVIRRKHIVQPTGFGACSSTCY